MKLICIESQSLFGGVNAYFIKNKIYEIIKKEEGGYVIDEEGFMWRYSTVSQFFYTQKELRKQKLEKISRIK